MQMYGNGGRTIKIDNPLGTVKKLLRRHWQNQFDIWNYKGYKKLKIERQLYAWKIPE